MRAVIIMLLLAIAGSCTGQITVDTAGGIVTVKEKIQSGIKAITIYRISVEGTKTPNHLIVYQPTAAEAGDEVPGPAMSFAAELPHIRALLDAAAKKKKFNFTRLSFNILPYGDMITKLVEVYSGSKEWNDYLKLHTDLKHTTTLYDGSQASELVYDHELAKNILDKSDFLTGLNTVFAAYGYRVTSGGFPDEHQLMVGDDKLIAMGKSKELLVPVPNSFFILTKIRQ